MDENAILEARAQKYMDAIKGRMEADGARDDSDSEIERTLGSCVCGHWLVPAAKLLRSKGAQLVGPAQLELLP